MPLPEFRLESFFSTWEFRAQYHLTASDAQTLALCELLDMADQRDRDRWERLQLGYIPTEGTPELRDAIAATYEQVPADSILLFAGAEEGLYCALHALLEPADHAVVLVPNYQSMESVPRSICEVSGVALCPQRDWDLDIDAVRAVLKPNTKLLAVNFPNNPTGKVIDSARFSELVTLCADRGIALFSDEVYRGIERDPARTLPQAADLYDRGFSLGGLAKSYGLPGLRVGWIASRDRDAIARMQHIKHYLSICNAAPSEVLATVAIKARDRIFARNRAIICENLRRLENFFARHADRIEWYEPDGGCVAYPKYLGAEGVEEFCGELLTRAGVLLLPASIYRSDLLTTPHDRFRIGYGRSGMDQALEAFDSFFATLAPARM